MRVAHSLERDVLAWLFGFLSGGSILWARRHQAVGATVRVLIGGLGCVGNGMVRMGGTRGVGDLVLPPISWRCLPRSASISPCGLCEVLWLVGSMDSGLYLGESPD
jgi:hypothetical protein